MFSWGEISEPRWIAATALAAVLQDTYIQRIAACAVDDFVERLG